MPQPGMETTVKTLNSFLRGEISAIETYRQAIDKVQQPPIRAQLQESLRSHESRVNVLNRIEQLGGEPAVKSGPWGAFAKLVEGGASLLGDKAAVSALEEGEDRRREDYRRELDKLDAQTRQDPGDPGAARAGTHACEPELAQEGAVNGFGYSRAPGRGSFLSGRSTNARRSARTAR